MPYTPSLDMSVRFTARADVVWAALTKHRYVSEWWPSLEFISRVDARYCVQTPRPHKKRPRIAVGRVTRIEPGQEVVLRIHSEPRGFDSSVTIIVSQLKHKSRVRIVEEGLPDGKYAELIAAECRDGWRYLLAALDDYLSDQRTIDRIARQLHDAEK